VAENGIARLKTVTAGRILGDKVEILNGCLMVKWLLPQVNLQDGNAIEIIK
jgi:hypothetical protein